MGSLTSRARASIKTVLPYVGLLALYHRLRNRDTLTVVVFHRVLAVDDERWPDAHPEWTVSDTVFAQCLRFFKQYYHVIGLSDLLASFDAGKRLPRRSLLITFDDGYADNEEYALPLLKQYRVPAVLFLTSNFINRRSRPWTEDLSAAFRQGYISADRISLLYKSLFKNSDSMPKDPSKQLGAICAEWPALPDSEADEIYTAVMGKSLPRRSDPAQMLSTEQLRQLHCSGVAIGAHGKTHTSLPLSNDLSSELGEPRRVLSELLRLPSDEISALAFPFGDYSDRVVQSALAEGYKLLFTFKPTITRLRKGKLSERVLDRINVSGPTIAPDGTATPERLARCFFFVPQTGVPAI